MSTDIEQFIESLPDLANARDSLVRTGRYCTTRFMIEVGETPWHVDVERGRVSGVVRGPLRMRAWTFAIRGPESAWRAFWSATPAPGFNDIFALARYGHARIEGDVGPLLENLRYVKELLALGRGRIGETAA